MIKSMTGFGRGQTAFKGGRVRVELKSINHRYFELSCRLPNSIAPLESKIKDFLHKRIKRGRVSLNLALEDSRGSTAAVTVNEELALKYKRLIGRLAKKMKTAPQISLKDIITLPEVIYYEPAEKEYSTIWPHVERALSIGLDKLVASRAKEGRFLAADLRKRIDEMSVLAAKIKTRVPSVIKYHRQQLKKRIEQISEGKARLNKERLELEVTLFAKSSDITEEITRISAHLKAFKDALKTTKEAGRKLDFTAQELFRETNTIGSKAQDVKITGWVIAAKEEIEKIREQVQNVE